MRDAFTLALLMPTATEFNMGRRGDMCRAEKVPKNTSTRGFVFLPLP